MSVLVDSSAWIAYFRGDQKAEPLDWLIDEDLVATNDAILAELLPVLIVRRQHRLAEVLKSVHHLPLTIDWSWVIDTQITCLRSGINKVGIPDLIIAHNAIHHRASLFTFDKHFRLISEVLPLTIY